MSDKSVPFARLKTVIEPRMSQDGQFVTIRLVTADGEQADLELVVNEMGALIAFLCGVADYAGRNRPEAEKPPGEERNELHAIAAKGLGWHVIDEDLAKAFPELFGPGRSERQVALQVSLPGFDLLFRTANMRAAGLPAWLRQSADKIEGWLDAPGAAKP